MTISIDKPQTTIIKNASMVNNHKIIQTDVKIVGCYIEQIAPSISCHANDVVIEAQGQWLLPGMIDDQVHFREPGLTHKGNIFSESRAAIAGGITSFMEMPNVSPATTTITELEKKYDIASRNSAANYSFYLGATEDNLQQIQQLDPKKHCGVKVFMGASTGDLLVEAPQALDNIFRESPALIVTHCESSPVIQDNLVRLRQLGKPITIEDHPIIRDHAACYASSSYAVDLAKKYGSQLHVLHLTTAKELALFSPGPVEGKHITAEACVHHLWFSDQDYAQLGNLIKCNPAIKTQNDRDALIQALKEGRIDIIATDHAPHTWQEKQTDYEQAPAGLPLVQHALLTLMDHVKAQRLTITEVVEKMAHNPAKRYKIDRRGYIQEGFFADLVLVDQHKPTAVTHENSLYQCAWTPYAGHTFSSSIVSTWVNGQKVFDAQAHAKLSQPLAMRLAFDR